MDTRHEEARLRAGLFALTKEDERRSMGTYGILELTAGASILELASLVGSSAAYSLQD